jgi:signal transduction histidine kinase
MTRATGRPVESPYSPRHSLRTRLVITSTVACLAAFVCVGLILYFSLRDSLYRQFDEALAARATALGALVEQEGPQVRVQKDPTVMAGYGANQSRNYFEIRTEEGTVIDRSPSLGGKAIPATRPAAADRDSDARATTRPGTVTKLEASLPDGREARGVAMPVVPRVDEDKPQPRPARPVTVVVASDVNRVEGTLFRFGKQIAIVCAGATLATAGALWFLISGLLRPVNAVAEQISRVGREDLTERLDPGHETPAELLPVVNRLNEMLTRLGSAFDREKAFTADVAHELRTPISALETALEVSGSRLREPEVYRQTVGQCLRTVRDMHALVDRLLTLARADARQLTVRPQPVELRPFVEEIWDVLASRAARRGVSLDVRIAPDATLTTDPDLLRHVVQNALDNAAAYAPRDSTVVVSTDDGSAPSALHFVNPAPDLTAEQASHVFDRFWRADHARQSGHVGLGLPLCQKLMHALGGSARVAADPPGVFHLTFEFPVTSFLPSARHAALGSQTAGGR